MRAPAFAMALGTVAFLGACSHSPTEGSWSCATPFGARSCASIHEIDEKSLPRALSQEGGLTLQALTGSAAFYSPAAAPLEAMPVREPDSTLRITFAPWIDAAGDFHEQADVIAVVRRGGWTLGTPAVDRAALPAEASRPSTSTEVAAK